MSYVTSHKGRTPFGFNFHDKSDRRSELFSLRLVTTNAGLRSKFKLKLLAMQMLRTYLNQRDLEILHKPDVYLPIYTTAICLWKLNLVSTSSNFSDLFHLIITLFLLTNHIKSNYRSEVPRFVTLNEYRKKCGTLCLLFGGENWKVSKILIIIIISNNAINVTILQNAVVKTYSFDAWAAASKLSLHKYKA